jgi:nitroreductase
VPEAIRARRSIRAFSSRAVDPSVVSVLLDQAAWATSGSNMQPWQVHVATGDALLRLRTAALGSWLDLHQGAAAFPSWHGTGT